VRWLALTVYAVGKTFFWPTMLAVASDRFPRSGAVAISVMGGVGMMSAGLIGSPGLGYAKDRFASEELIQADATVYANNKSKSPSKFLFFEEVNGIDGRRLGEIKAIAPAQRSTEDQTVVAADMRGDRRTLVADSFIPATMAVIYLLLLLYFKSIGGYKTVHLEGTDAAKVQA
jgi:hypothetical protein